MLRVPEEFATVQAAVDAAVDGDTVLVAPGVYGPVVIDGVDLTLASRFLTSGDDADITATVIDGNGTDFAVSLSGTTDATRIIGFTIRNADDGVVTRDARMQFLDNVVRDTNDGIDFESSSRGTSGGVVRDSVFEHNGDDGIDLDDATAVVIERSILRHNDNDGIEIRLHGHVGPTLDVELRDNEIHDNGGDGIQLIGYAEPGNRSFLIEGNLIHHNAQAGVGLMDDEETDEDFRGAALRDPIRVRQNTFVANAWAFTGGANVQFEGNVVLDSLLGGLKNMTGSSFVSHSGFWGNAVDTENVQLGAGNVFADPLLGPDHRPGPGSPYVGAGPPECVLPDGSVCDIGAVQAIDGA